MSDDNKNNTTVYLRFSPPRVGEGVTGNPDFSRPVQISHASPQTDGYGRNVTGWISVGGKLKPHP